MLIPDNMGGMLGGFWTRLVQATLQLIKNIAGNRESTNIKGGTHGKTCMQWG